MDLPSLIILRIPGENEWVFGYNLASVGHDEMNVGYDKTNVVCDAVNVGWT